MRRTGNIWAILLCALCLVSCEKNRKHDQTTEFESVMIMCSVGHNNLSTKLQEDLQDIQASYVPGKNEKKALLVISHFPTSSGDFDVPTSPSVVRLTRGKKDQLIVDTLAKLSAGSSLAEKAGMTAALKYVQEHFPSKQYGMVLSSHGTGWLPEGYYASGQASGGQISLQSFGSEDIVSGGTSRSYELDVRDLADCIPFHLDYLVFDACLMGGVEVAYELKDVCDLIAFCPTETLTDGFNYQTLSPHLLEGPTPDVQKVCQDFFDMYDSRSGGQRAATVTLVDCRKMQSLATVCKGLFAQYRESLRNAPYAQIQPYFRGSKHWFYDLEDILVKCGITESELRTLRSAMDECIIYKAATERFLTITINVYSPRERELRSGRLLQDPGLESGDRACRIKRFFLYLRPHL